MSTDSSESEAFGEDPYQPKDNELQEYVEGIAKLNGSMLSNIHLKVKETWNIEDIDLASCSRWIDNVMKSTPGFSYTSGNNVEDEIDVISEDTENNVEDEVMDIISKDIENNFEDEVVDIISKDIENNFEDEVMDDINKVAENIEDA